MIINNEGQQVNQPQTDAAPKAFSLRDVLQRCNSQNGWSGVGQDYINSIRTQIEDPAATIKGSMHHISDTAVAFNHEDNGIVLVHEGDMMNYQELINEVKLYNAKQAYYSAFPKKKLLNIVTVNRFMFNRPIQMASYINNLFLSQSDMIKSFNYQSFGSQNSIDINTDIGVVRRFFEMHSTTPVFCGNFGFVASLADKNSNRSAGYNQPTPMFGVSGYVEFIRNDSDGTFTPIVHVTDILSVLPTNKILALALPLIGGVIISRNIWKQPFSAIAKDNNINIGNLIIDANSGKPYEVKSDADFRQMFRQYIGDPLLCIDIKSGGADIPGLNRLIRQSEHIAVFNEILEFFGEAPLNACPPIAQNIFREIIGASDIAKNNMVEPIDSRDINYLYTVAKAKYNPRLDYLLARNEYDPVRRFEAIKEIYGDITPTHISATTMFHNDFLGRIVNRLNETIKIDIPNVGDTMMINMNEFASKAYKPNMPMFGQGQSSFNIGGWSSF
jgi:hypothetical protein